MNTVAVNSSTDVLYSDIKPGSVFQFLFSEGPISPPALKLELGYVFLDTEYEYQYKNIDNAFRYLKCRLIQSP